MANMGRRDSLSLTTFTEEYSPKKALVVCQEREERLHGNLRILPRRRFLENLWGGKIIR